MSPDGIRPTLSRYSDAACSASGHLHRLLAGASILRPAFAAGRNRSVLRPGVNRVENRTSHQSEHIAMPRLGANRHGRVCIFPRADRSALEGHRSASRHRSGPVRPGGLRRRSNRAAPHLSKGKTPRPAGLQVPRLFLAVIDGTGDSPFVSSRFCRPEPGCRPAKPFGIASRARSRKSARPSSTFGVGRPFSPTPRSEVHPVEANRG